MGAVARTAAPGGITPVSVALVGAPRAQEMTTGTVVIAHDFAETYGGAERVTAEIAREFTDASVHTILGRQAVAERMGVGDRFHSMLPESKPLLKGYRALAPAYPEFVRRQRLPEADVLITSSYAYVHGLRTRNDAPQLCYCHGPLRFAWSQVGAYADEMPGGAIGRKLFPTFASAMRRLDVRAASEVTRYVTQSPYTAQQIERFYGVEAHVLAPPVDTETFRPSRELPGDYYLFAGRLVEAYKKPSLVVEAFSKMRDKRLVVAGAGPALAALREMATPNVEFVGQLESKELVEAMGRAQATIFPSIDDFGLIPVEVAACGRPTLAFAGGGALHTVREGVSGLFFDRQDADAIVDAVRRSEDVSWDPFAIREHAMRWDRETFRSELRRHVAEVSGGAVARAAESFDAELAVAA